MHWRKKQKDFKGPQHISDAIWQKTVVLENIYFQKITIKYFNGFNTNRCYRLKKPGHLPGRSLVIMIKLNCRSKLNQKLTIAFYIRVTLLYHIKLLFYIVKGTWLFIFPRKSSHTYMHFIIIINKKCIGQGSLIYMQINLSRRKYLSWQSRQ